ncbi:MAG: ketoacyl-ACP synthase III [Prevotellaceae bacterium]|jgi:3-oxoacyl-[acyl-carrier-protein] synthase-3|nr:ketoacyl-ACP synthase III [Prevotellaceae bacterium]
MAKITAAITGVGGYAPEYILTNEEISKMVDTSDEWIMTRIGIKERHILREPGMATSDMAVEAILDLFKKTGCKPEEVDMLLWCGVTPDMPFPSTANIISDKLGVKNAFGYDINAGCSSFLYTLATASKFVESGSHKKVVVVGADKMSSIVDYTARNTCPIFGDGAGAALIEPNTDGLGVIDAMLRVDGSGRKYLFQAAGGSLLPATMDTVLKRQHFIFQEGQPVFKAAVSNMSDTTVAMMQKHGLTADTLTWLVPHQANLRIIKACADRANLSMDKVMVNIERYGNTTAGTIPLCLWDYEKKLKIGDNLIIATFGAGFTWGAMYLKWAYDGSTRG